MADFPQSPVADAVKPDGFVDFYQLISEAPNAPAEQVKTRISTLYDEAQANRDHRNIHKRRDYQLLLELLPQARSVLLDPGKRARYDEYAEQARNNRASIGFDEFMSQMTADAGTEESERVGVLGVQESTTKGATGKAAKVKPAAATQTASSNQSAAGSPSSPLVGAAISLIVAALVFVLVRMAAHQEIPIALGAAAVAGAIAFLLAHFTLGARTKV